MVTNIRNRRMTFGMLPHTSLEMNYNFCHFWRCILAGAYKQEQATPLYFCHGVFIDRFIFRTNLLWMRLPWECHNQSQDTSWRHCVTGPELRFFHKRKDALKIDQSVKMPRHRLSTGVASFCSSAPDIGGIFSFAMKWVISSQIN